MEKKHLPPYIYPREKKKRKQDKIPAVEVSAVSWETKIKSVSE